jgi:hypothetical protein
MEERIFYISIFVFLSLVIYFMFQGCGEKYSGNVNMTTLGYANKQQCHDNCNQRYERCLFSGGDVTGTCEKIKEHCNLKCSISDF